MDEKVLFVDDDQRILDSYRRQFHSKLPVLVADSPVVALDTLATIENIAVIVSDLRMPYMSGSDFLIKVRAQYPDIVRIMLTGEADVSDAMKIVNEGQVFRFLMKPVNAYDMARTLIDALAQFRLQRSEKVLLEQTLKGSIKVMSEVLSLANPTAFSKTSMIARLCREIAKEVAIKNQWQLEIAALLSQIGTISLPESILKQIQKGEPIDEKYLLAYEQHPEITYKLLTNIPRLDEIAKIIQWQMKSHKELDKLLLDGANEEVVQAAKILSIVNDFEKLAGQQDLVDTYVALLEFKKQERRKNFDPALLTAIENAVKRTSQFEIDKVNLINLKIGMIIIQDIHAVNGALLVGQGQEVTDSLKQRLLNISLTTKIREPVNVIYSSGELNA